MDEHDLAYHQQKKQELMKTCFAFYESMKRYSDLESLLVTEDELDKDKKEGGSDVL